MTKQDLFMEIMMHLEKDQRPSEYLKTLLAEPCFKQEPFRPLFLLSKTEQSKKYHPEGNAWIHTLMVVDEAAKVRDKSTRPKDFMMASFLHDIGKPETTAIRKGRITSYGHDEEGERLARKLLEEFLEEKEEIDYIVALVRYHMHILFVVKNMPYARTKQMIEEACIEDVALLGWCDRMGRTGADALEEQQNIRQFYEMVQKKKAAT